jgi:hypothetical protein
MIVRLVGNDWVWAWGVGADIPQNIHVLLYKNLYKTILNTFSISNDVLLSFDLFYVHSFKPM